MRAHLLVVAALLSGCILNKKENEGLAFLDVKLVTPAEGARGTEAAPLDTPRGNFPIRIAVTALDAQGVAMDCEEGHRCYQGTVSLGVTPGWIPVPNPLNADADPENDDAKRPFVMSLRGGTTLDLVNGRGERALDLRGTFAATHVWAEEWPSVSEGEERPSRYTAGVSDSLYFSFPTIQDLQFEPAAMGPGCKAASGAAPPGTSTCDNTTSPLVDNFVTSRQSRYLVTGITNDGFFISDLALDTAPEIGSGDTLYPGRFESLFLYSFSYPDDLFVGDVVNRVFGTVQEFTGDTQMTFPTWEKEDPTITEVDHFNARCGESADCPEKFLCQDGFCRLAPTVVNDAICAYGAGSGNNANLCGDSSRNVHLESLESGRIEIIAFMPTIFRNCDFNGDGDVPNVNPNVPCNDECTCKVACIKEEGCTERSALHTYGTYSVIVEGPRKYKINVITRDSTPGVNPTIPVQEDAAGLVYGGVRVRVRGNLRQSLPARPKWTIVAGEKLDFCCLPARPEDAGKCRDIPMCEDAQ